MRNLKNTNALQAHRINIGEENSNFTDGDGALTVVSVESYIVLNY